MCPSASETGVDEKKPPQKTDKTGIQRYTGNTGAIFCEKTGAENAIHKCLHGLKHLFTFMVYHVTT